MDKSHIPMNLKISNVWEEGVEIFKKFFPTPIITVGSLVRKAPYLILELCALPDVETVEFGGMYNDKENMYHFAIKTRSSNSLLINNSHTATIECALSASRFQLNEINNFFNHDKYCRIPIIFARIEWLCKHGKYTYTKALDSTNKHNFYLRIIKESRSFSEYLKTIVLSIKNSFKSESQHKILSWKILKQTDAHNIAVVLANLHDK